MFKPGTWAQQKILKARVRRTLQAAPLFDRNQNGSFDTATSYNLRTILDRRVQQFAKTSLRILHLPRSHRSPPEAYYTTGQVETVCW